MKRQEQPQANHLSTQKPHEVQASQVWCQLTPLQQQQTFQRIIQMCRLLTQSMLEKEVTDEQR